MGLGLKSHCFSLLMLFAHKCDLKPLEHFQIAIESFTHQNSKDIFIAKHVVNFLNFFVFFLKKKKLKKIGTIAGRHVSVGPTYSANNHLQTFFNWRHLHLFLLFRWDSPSHFCLKTLFKDPIKMA